MFDIVKLLILKLCLIVSKQIYTHLKIAIFSFYFIFITFSNSCSSLKTNQLFKLYLSY